RVLRPVPRLAPQARWRREFVDVRRGRERDAGHVGGLSDENREARPLCRPRASCSIGTVRSRRARSLIVVARLSCYPLFPSGAGVGGRPFSPFPLRGGGRGVRPLSPGSSLPPPAPLPA